MNSNRHKRSRAVAGNENHSPPKKLRRLSTALYLDDNTPVRTIEVTNFGDNVTSEYLRGYFEQAARDPVSDVSIVFKLENNQKVRVAFVTFARPEGAARLYFDQFVLNIKFTIKQADRAYQPKIDPNALKFEEVNDDCLFRIASYLNLIDIVNLGKTSRRFRSFTERIYRKQTHFSFGTNTGDSSINEINVPTILEEMGSYIQSIEWHHLDSFDLIHLSLHCVNVTELKLKHPLGLHSADIKEFKSFFKQIQKLEIYEADLFDISLKMLTTSSQLTSLQLDTCRNVRGKFLSTWKKSNLKSLKISNSSNMDCQEVFDFERKYKLAQLSFDARCSFRQCFMLPAECLSKLTEVEMEFSHYTDSYLNELNFGDLTELTKLTMTYKYENDFTDINNLLTAMRHIRRLESLTIGRITVDANTVKCLGSLANLRKIHLKKCDNTIGPLFYSSLAFHLPNITEMSIDVLVSEETSSSAICDMICSFNHLKYFSHSSMTWEWIDLIVQLRSLRKQPPPIEIGISKSMFHCSKKDAIAEISKKGVIVILSKE